MAMETNHRKMLLLIDGSSLLSTAYFALLPNAVKMEHDEEKRKLAYPKIMHNSEGKYTNAILGFMRQVHDFMEKINPSHMMFAFDLGRSSTFRAAMYPEYKGQRKSSQEPLKEQFQLIQEMLGDCGFAVEADPLYEADDFVGSAVEKYKGAIPIRAFSKDKDYFQLVDDEKNVRLWVQFEKEKAVEMNEGYKGIFGYEGVNEEYGLPASVVEFTEETVMDHFGCPPELVADLKGIAGDTSDNIPGVRGVSAAAAPLLNYYGSVESLYDDVNGAVGKVAEKELVEFWKSDLGISRNPLNALRKGEEDAFLCKKLATIKRDVELKHGLEKMSVGRVDKKKLKEWYTELELESLMGKVS